MRLTIAYKHEYSFASWAGVYKSCGKLYDKRFWSLVYDLVLEWVMKPTMVCINRFVQIRFHKSLFIIGIYDMKVVSCYYKLIHQEGKWGSESRQQQHTHVAL